MTFFSGDFLDDRRYNAHTFVLGDYYLFLFFTPTKHQLRVETPDSAVAQQTSDFTWCAGHGVEPSVRGTERISKIIRDRNIRSTILLNEKDDVINNCVDYIFI